METFEMVGPAGRISVTLSSARLYLKQGYKWREGEEERYDAALKKRDAALAEPAVAEPEPERRSVSRRTRFQSE